MIEIILLIIGFITVFVAGYFYGKAKTYQHADGSKTKSREKNKNEREKVCEEKERHRGRYVNDTGTFVIITNGHKRN